ncbi:MAG TPA: formate dehydrogenase accessory sulfurtransferase FdhD [Motilibacteraceae bacterium]|jgi:FdhD protein|nr:formate dehydrogenase accessory sulfurtransferase FdhD [Motilibacteraceae bacterium]
MTLARRPGPSTRVRVTELRGDQRLQHEDRLATEEPLEVRLASPGAPARRVGITMRTPGNDFELAAGWLVHEGITRPEDIDAVRYCTDVRLVPEQEFNVVTVDLSAAPLLEPEARVVTAACGVCGRDAVVDSLRAPGTVPDLTVALDTVRALPGALREEQRGFDRTGGLHAAGLFEADGTRVLVREDVGRHNAVDKAVGARYLGRLPVPPVLVLSGRIGFELVQKAVVAGVGVVVAVGAPSSLAVQLAAEAGVTLVGFTRGDRCVVYAGADRIGV